LVWMWRQTLYMRESPPPRGVCTEIVCFQLFTADCLYGDRLFCVTYVSSGILMRKIPANAQKKQVLRFAQNDRTDAGNFSNRYVQVPPLRCASAGMTTHFGSHPIRRCPPGCKREKAWPGPCLSYSLANYGVILRQA